jgi:hypothetical protein
MPGVAAASVLALATRECSECGGRCDGSVRTRQATGAAVRGVAKSACAAWRVASVLAVSFGVVWRRGRYVGWAPVNNR